MITKSFYYYFFLKTISLFKLSQIFSLLPSLSLPSSVPLPLSRLDRGMILLGQLAHVSGLGGTYESWTNVFLDGIANIKTEPNLKIADQNFQTLRNKIKTNQT